MAQRGASAIGKEAINLNPALIAGNHRRMAGTAPAGLAPATTTPLPAPVRLRLRGGWQGNGHGDEGKACGQAGKAGAGNMG